MRINIKPYWLADGEWSRPVQRGYYVSCCDCGLTHRLNFRVVRGEVQVQSFRDPLMTKAVRRKFFNGSHAD